MERPTTQLLNPMIISVCADNVVKECMLVKSNAYVHIYIQLKIVP